MLFFNRLTVFFIEIEIQHALSYGFLDTYSIQK